MLILRADITPIDSVEFSSSRHTRYILPCKYQPPQQKVLPVCVCTLAAHDVLVRLPGNRSTVLFDRDPCESVRRSGIHITDCVWLSEESSKLKLAPLKTSRPEDNQDPPKPEEEALRSFQAES